MHNQHNLPESAPLDLLPYQATSCEKFTKRFIIFLLVAQAGGYTVFDTFFSIQRSNNQKILGFIDPEKNIWWIATLYFLVTNGENFSLANNSSRRYCEIIRTKQLPSDWPIISDHAKRLMLLFSLTFTGTVAFSECVSSAYAIQELGYDARLAYTIGLLSGAAALTSWPQMCELLFEVAAWKNSTYRNSVSEWICKLIGFPLAILSSAQVITDSYYPMVDEFTVLSKSARWGIFIVSSFSAMSYLSTYSKMGIDAIDEFIGKVSTGECPSFTEFISFSTSIFGSALLTDLARARILSFLLSPEIALPFALYEWMIDGIAWSSALYGGAISAHNAFPYLLKISDGIKNRLISAYDTCADFIKKKTADEETVDPPPDNVIPIRVSLHRNTLFPPPHLKIPTRTVPTLVIEPHQNNLAEDTPLVPRENCCNRLMKWFGF